MQIARHAVQRRGGFLTAFTVFAVLVTSVLPSVSAVAQQEADKAAQIKAEQKAAIAAADKVAKLGPAAIKLVDQAELALPAGYTFVAQPEAGRLMRANGNTPGKTLLGLVFPSGTGRDWWAIVRFEPSGYVKDDEAKNWDAAGLLKNIQEGTEAGNEDRVSRGFNPIEVTGWVEPPVYESSTQRLVWSAAVRDKGDASDPGAVNYNTYALGRDGYISLDLITGFEAIAADKAHAKDLLAAIAFLPGKKYSDFNASTDHVAEFGIAALVGGLAAKKFGLLAVAGAFLLKAWKLAAIGLVALGAAWRRIAAFFTRRKPAEPHA